MLHLAIIRGDSFAASFLIKNGANTNQTINTTNETPLHLISSYSPSRALSDMPSGGKTSWPSDHMAQVASLLLEYGANPDAQDCFGNTAMHRAVQSKNEEVFNVLLNHDRYVCICMHLCTYVCVRMCMCVHSCIRHAIVIVDSI